MNISVQVCLLLGGLSRYVMGDENEAVKREA